MQTVIAIEGIDRIGKSTFINELRKKLDYFLGTYERITISVDKPTIGINTLKNMGYPLQDIPNIMEIRNIGLFEEFLFQAQKDDNKYIENIIIRDRFNISELAYGAAYRPNMFNKTLECNESLHLYREWNNWFEEKLDACAKVYLFTFVLDETSYPNEDEAISASALVKVNEQFKKEHELSKFKKKFLFKLHKNQETGYTNILDFVDEVIYHITGICKNNEPFYQIISNVYQGIEHCILAFGNTLSVYEIGEGDENDNIVLKDGSKINRFRLFNLLKPHMKRITEEFENNKDFVDKKNCRTITDKGNEYLELEIASIIGNAYSDIDSNIKMELPFEPPTDLDVPF